MTTPAEKKPPAEAKAPVIQPMLYKSVVTVYRIFAIVTLYAVLGGVLAYGFVMGFYAVNTTWAAPVILSPADDKSLDFTEKLVTSRQTLEEVSVDKKKLDEGIEEMQRHRAALMALEPELQAAIIREKKHNQATGPQLMELDKQKQADNLKTQAVMAQLKEVEARIDKDLASGLITKGDAATQRAALNQAENSYTDSKIGEILLTDSVLEKTTTDTKTLNVLDKQAELISEIAQLDIAISVAQKQIHEDTQQIDRLKQAIATAKQTPYYLSVSGDTTVYFAFVPYDNQKAVFAGAAVYDCYLNMVICKKVGTVKQIFPGEEHATHPIFRTDIRGFLIQMHLDRPESAKSKTVFLDRKPLIF
jgi:CII-binding regulator of phage lambda lysogenization HflD